MTSAASEPMRQASPSPKPDNPGARATQRIAVVILWITITAPVLGLTINNSIPGGGPFLLLILIAGPLLFLAFAAWLTTGITALIRRRMNWSLILAPALFVAGYFFAYSAVPEQLHWPVMRASLADAGDECPYFAGLARVESCMDVLGSTGYDFGGGLTDRIAIVHLDAEQLAELHDNGGAGEGIDGWHEMHDLGDDWYVVRLPL